jgi:aspartate kinase
MNLDKNPVVVVSAHNSPKCRMTDTLIAQAEAALAAEPDASRVFDLQRGLCADLDVPTSLVDPLLESYERLLTGIHMIGEISPRTMDLVQSFGERMSSRVFADVLRREFGVETACETSYDLGLLTDGVFGTAQPDPQSYPDMKRTIHTLKADAVVTTGFLGKGPDGHITTLGRGGSDFSATIFGAALGADEVQIWTDVDGIMTADPGLVPAARSIPLMSFDEASELAWYGAKVLHPATMTPAIEHGIPVRVLNTAKPEHPGTLIRPTLPREQDATPKSIVYKENVHLVTVTSTRMLGATGFMARVFEVFARHDLDIHMIATSEVSISLTVPGESDVRDAVQELGTCAEVEVEHDRAILCVVGQNMAGVPGTAARVTKALAEAGVNIHMISQGAKELNIALLVTDEDIRPAITTLHKAFFE